MRGRTWRRLFAAAIGSITLASPAAALTEIVGDAATLEWQAATGPVRLYLVYIEKNGGGLKSYAYRGPEANFVTIFGQPGDEFQVAVQAYSEDPSSQPSALSERSEVVRLTAAPLPPVEEPPVEEPPVEEPPVEEPPVEEPPVEEPPVEEPPVEEPPVEEPPVEEPPVEEPPVEEPPEVEAPLAAPARPLDFNGDLRTDLLFLHPATGALKVWIVRGDEVEEVTDLGLLRAGQVVAGNADYDGDGYADLLAYDSDRGELEVRFLVGGRQASSVTIDVGSDWTIGGSADFDRDGIAEVLLHDPGSGDLETVDAFGGGTVLPETPDGTRVLGLVDLEDDGRVDIIQERARNSFFGASYEFYLWSVDGDNAFEDELGDSPGISVDAACELPGSERDTFLFFDEDANDMGMLFFDWYTFNVDDKTIDGPDSDLYEAPVAGAGDFDGDGRCDYAVQSPNGDVTVILLDQDNPRGLIPLGTPGDGWQPAGVASEAPRTEP